jgi:isopropylmalate/homocitrate/citramalate synthase
MDIVTMAMNLYVRESIGAISNPDEMSVVGECARMPLHHAILVGELVYTAFSGSHQDAIANACKSGNRMSTGRWPVAD